MLYNNLCEVCARVDFHDLCFNTRGMSIAHSACLVWSSLQTLISAKLVEVRCVESQSDEIGKERDDTKQLLRKKRYIKTATM